MSARKDSGQGIPVRDAILEITNALASASIEADYIFRGETEIHDKISSGLYRDMAGRLPDSVDIEAVQHRNLEDAKRYTQETDEMAILTELQHYGERPT